MLDSTEHGITTRAFHSLVALFIFIVPVLDAKSPILSQDGMFALNADERSGTVSFSRTLGGYEKKFASLSGFSTESFPPVLVVLHSATDISPEVSSVRVDAIEGGLPHVQLDIVHGQENGNLVRNLLATAMLLREYYGASAPLSGALLPVYPAWLTHGLGMLCSAGDEGVVIPSRYLRGEAPPAVEDFLIQKAPDAENRSLSDLYDAMAAALLQAALTQHGGGDNAAVFRDWIGHYDPNVPHSNSPSWPAGWKMRAVEKRWLLIMSSKNGDDDGFPKVLGVPETVASYDVLLAELPTPGHSMALLRKEKGGDFLARDLSSRMLALRLQANPMAAPLLDGTIQLLSSLRHLPPQKLVAQEKNLLSLRAAVLKQSRLVEEYLDWYEAAKIPIRSGLFEHLLSTPVTPIKKGPVGHYLDVIEERGW